MCNSICLDLAYQIAVMCGVRVIPLCYSRHFVSVASPISDAERTLNCRRVAWELDSRLRYTRTHTHTHIHTNGWSVALGRTIVLLSHYSRRLSSLATRAICSHLHNKLNVASVVEAGSREAVVPLSPSRYPVSVPATVSAFLFCSSTIYPEFL